MDLEGLDLEALGLPLVFDFTSLVLVLGASEPFGLAPAVPVPFGFLAPPAPVPFAALTLLR